MSDKLFYVLCTIVTGVAIGMSILTIMVLQAAEEVQAEFGKEIEEPSVIANNNYAK